MAAWQERKLSAFFRPEHAPQESDHASPETEGLPEQPSTALIQYVNETVERQTGKPFSLMDVALRIDPRAIDRTIRNTLGQILANLCEVIHAYNCDLLLLTGRPPNGTRSFPVSSPSSLSRRTASSHARFPGGKLVPLPTTGARSPIPRRPWWSGPSSAPVRRPSRRLFL